MKKYQIEYSLSKNELKYLENIVLNGQIEGFIMNTSYYMDFDVHKHLEKIFENYTKLKSLTMNFELSHMESSLELLSLLLKQNKIIDFSLTIKSINETMKGTGFFKFLDTQTNFESLKLVLDHDLSENDFKDIQQIINQNTKLKNFYFKMTLNGKRTYIDLPSQWKGLKQHLSLENLELVLKKVSIQDFSFLRKFQKLKFLKIDLIQYDLNILLESTHSKYLPFLNSIKIKLRNPRNVGYLINEVKKSLKRKYSKLEMEEQSIIDFSHTSINNFDISSSKMNFFTLKHFLLGLLKIKHLKSLNLSQSIQINDDNRQIFNDENLKDVETYKKSKKIREFIPVLSDIISKSKHLKHLDLSFSEFSELEFKLIIESLQQNESISSLFLFHLNFENLGKELGLILSQKNYEYLDLSIKSKIYDTMFHFHKNSFVKRLDLFTYLDYESSILLSKFIQNNNNLNELYIGMINNEGFKFVSKSIGYHKNIKKFTISEHGIASEKFIIEMIQNSQSLKELCFCHIEFDSGNLIEVLGKNRILDSFCIYFTDEILKLDNLFYNYNLNYYDGRYSPFNHRNSGFIKNYYQPISFFNDIFMNFK